MIAPRVVEQGIGYLTERKYEVFATYGKDAAAIDPASVDWAAVAGGATRWSSCAASPASGTAWAR